ncbi:hypothetical protein F7R20_16625 [Pseudomonas brassicacearum subsp. brassicacearum]|nr:hypothetical protein F7R20_16625 [Pseudomonas brassicacearum subsp. brassicacearum]PJH89035.1 hypothetical protein CVG87_10805 [Pseudomonas sp. WCS365]QEO76447.1 hypothetical protein ELZ14_02345 [Pseudomonas brassicacearum]
MRGFFCVDRSHAPRGNASTDAPRSALDGTRSVPGYIPTRSVGTINIHPCGSRACSRWRQLSLHRC